MPTPLPRPGPTDYQDAPGTELDLVWDELCDVVEATEATANAALPATQAAAGTLIAAAADKATPADADSVALSDSAASGILKKLTWGNLRAALASLFASLSGSAGGQTLTGGTASGENLTLRSTAHATRGAIIFGSASEYDEANDRLGIGTLTPSAKVHSLATTEQLRLGYDASNYLSALVASSGLVTLTGTLGQYRLSGPTAANATATLGSELITNGGFTSDLSGWAAGAGWSWSSGGALHAAGNTATLESAVTVTSGNTYQLAVVISGRTAGYVAMALGAVAAIESEAATLFAVSSARTVVAGASGSVTVTITPTASFDGRIDDVSLKSVTLGSFPPAMGLLEAGSMTTELRQSRLRQVVSLGQDAGRSNTTGFANTNVGVNAGYSNTTGTLNTNYGRDAGNRCTVGIANTNVGVNSGYTNASGVSNTNIGANAGYSLTTGSSNTNVGDNAGYRISTGTSNCSIGRGAGRGITTGNTNTYVGRDVGYNQETGNGNVAVGNNAARYIADGVTALVTGNNCVYIGTLTKASADSVTNENVFGYNATGIGSNSCVLGSGAVTKCQIFGDIILDKTVTAGGTTGAQTINKTVGSVNFAVGATSLVVTNNRVATTSIIMATVATNDATLKSVIAVAASGSFTLHANAAATAETRVNFIVIN